MEINGIEILSYIPAVALGALSLYFKRSAAVEKWIAEIKGSADKYIAKAEKEFKGTQRGGEKFDWVVETLHMLLPVFARKVITKEMIGDIVQGAFDAMSEYAAAKLDKAITKEE